MKNIILFLLIGFSCFLILKGENVVVKDYCYGKYWNEDSVKSKQIHKQILNCYRFKNLDKSTLPDLIKRKMDLMAKKSKKEIFYIAFGIWNDTTYVMVENYDLWILLESERHWATINEFNGIKGVVPLKVDGITRYFVLSDKSNGILNNQINKIFQKTNDSISFIRETIILPDGDFSYRNDLYNIYIGFINGNKLLTRRFQILGKNIKE